MTVSFAVPFPQIPDAAGAPLDGGFIYMGVANLDAVANPVAVFFDAALTVSATQPLRTSGGFVVNGSGTPQNVYTAGDFSVAVKDRNNVSIYSAPSYGFRVFSAAVTFGALIVNTSIVPDAAGGAFNGSAALPWATTVTRTLQAKTISVFSQTQPAVTSDLVKQTQLCVDVLCCRQTSVGAVATLVNLLNTASITRTALGRYSVVPTVNIPTACVVLPSLSIPGAGTTPAIFVLSRAGNLVTLHTLVNGVDTDMPFDLLIKGNPAVADPIS